MNLALLQKHSEEVAAYVASLQRKRLRRVREAALKEIEQREKMTFYIEDIAPYLPHERP